MDALATSSCPVEIAPEGKRQCVFCLEDIRPGASVCPHCGSNLGPVQALAERQAALEERLAGLERTVTELQPAKANQAATADPATGTPAPPPLTGVAIHWPHMADNILLGLAALLVAHWLATATPAHNRALFRLVALIVALPFGYRFEQNARSSTSGQAVAALAFGSLGTLAIGVLDLALAGPVPELLNPRDIIASVAAIALSHFAGSALASARRNRSDRAASDAADRAPGARMHIEPARIKSTADAVKALYDAVAPLAAGAAALWAAFGHIVS